MEQLAAGAAELGIDLSRSQIEQFERYHGLLLEWNSRVNLTALTGRSEVQRKHFLDSLSVTKAIPGHLLDSGRFADVGSGAGFPGVPLKIAFPGLSATLIESTSKKTAFLVGLGEVLGLSDLVVLTGRAETLAHRHELREGFDFVLTRAVASMAALAELTLPFCRLGGIVIAQKKLGIEDELARARKAIETMGGELAEVKRGRPEGPRRCQGPGGAAKGEPHARSVPETARDARQASPVNTHDATSQ